MNAQIIKRKTTNRGLKNWSKNALRFWWRRFLALFNSEDSQIWVFSTWEGNKYCDNSKYLYEYVKNNCPDIQPYWITKNEEIYNELKESGQDVCLVGTDEAINIQNKASVSFFTHGLDDFGDFPGIYGSYIVNLWHGVPLNKLGYYTLPSHKSNLLKKLGVIKARFFSYIYCDLTIATSPKAVDHFKAFTLTKNPITIIGQPRTDILLQKFQIEDVLRKDFISEHNLSNGSNKYILFMPTYRASAELQIKLEECLRNLVNNKELNAFLKETDCKLLMKMHYLTDISGMEFTENILFLDDREVKDSEMLLTLADLLITDYSSVAFDYALTNHDILFFTPDLSQYKKESGIMDDFGKILDKYGAASIDKLIRKICESYERSFAASETTLAINQLCNTRASELGNFCELVTEYVIDQLKGKKRGK